MWVSASHPDMPARQSSDDDDDVDSDDDHDDDRLVAIVDISSGQRRLALFVSQHRAQSRLGSLVRYQIAAAAHPADCPPTSLPVDQGENA